MRIILLSLVLLAACAASAQVKQTSRTLTPLNQPKSKSASSRGSETGLSSATAPREVPPNTVTKITFVGPKSGWGFVKTGSPYYSPQGKHLGSLPGGTLFKYSDVKTSSKNAMLVSTVKRGEAWEGPFLLDCTEIAAYEGSPDTLDLQILADLGLYFSLLGKAEDRKAQLSEQALSANPHFNSARQAQKAYQDSIAKAAELERQMNTLTGARKSKALDTLRAFKYEQVRIKAKADQEAAAYKVWKDAHPASPAALAADPQLQTLEQELRQAKAKVAKLVPADE